MEEQSVYIWSGGYHIIISNEHVCGSFLRPPTPHHHHHHSTLKQIKISLVGKYLLFSYFFVNAQISRNLFFCKKRRLRDRESQVSCKGRERELISNWRKKRTRHGPEQEGERDASVEFLARARDSAYVPLLLSLYFSSHCARLSITDATA